jgi:Ca-activated chloride channel family protein
MTLRAALILALLSGASALLPQETIRVDVRLVRLLATVKDSAGRLVGSLAKDDFTIYDNGVKQEVAIFERQTEQPLSIALLVDTSASTGKDLGYEIASVQRFLKALFREGHPQDAVALYSFNYDVVVESTFTRRISRLEQAMKRLKAEGGTSLYDAIHWASRDLEEREGRHVLVVVTDGGDTTSSKDFHAALEAAQRADAVIYAILVMPITNDPGRNIGGENALTTMTSWTGGRVFAPSVGPDLDRAFEEILNDLRTQYMLAYYPRNIPLTKERYHRLKVALRRPDLRVQTRTGYYGEAEDSSGARR